MSCFAKRLTTRIGQQFWEKIGESKNRKSGRHNQRLAVAAGILYPFFGILLNPVFAAGAMAMSSVSVVGNSLRLRRLWAKMYL